MSGAGRDELAFDVVVIGAGTAGLAAAKAAHAEGASVAVVDHGPLGTFCARLGCMPSKALLQSALSLARARRSGALGVVIDGTPRLDWAAVRARKSELVAAFVDDTARAITTSKCFTLLRGAAEFVDAGTLRVGERRVVARAWVLATGSVPVKPPIPSLDDVADRTIVSDDVFDLESVPRSVAVIGAGAVGVELGQLLARAGAEVHLVGKDERVAGLAAGALLDALVRPLARELTLHRSARVTGLRRAGDGVVLTFENEGELRVDTVLLAAGRRPNLDGLALERAGVRVEDGVPVHDEHLRTTHRAIFVAGDAAGAPALLHTAALQGRAAGRNAARLEADPVGPAIDPLLRIVFCDPIAATVGLDPDAAKEAGHRVCVVTRPWTEQGKARIMNETDGLAELVVDAASRAILGCRIVGPHADLLIHLASYAMCFGAKVDDLVTAHHYHPTLAEMMASLAQLAVSELDGARFSASGGTRR